MLTVGVPAAAVVGLRVLWGFVAQLRSRAETEFGRSSARLVDWFRRLGSHFVGRAVREKWIVYYALGRYSRSLHHRHAEMTVPGRNLSLPIDRCFIPMELRSGQGSLGHHILERRGTVLLLGDPGSGKSALLSQYLRSVSRSCMENRSRSRVPVYVQLESIATDIPRGILKPGAAFDLLESWFDEHELQALGLFDARGMLASMSSSPSNGVVVLLDGLDELGAERIARVEGFIVALSQYLAAAPGRNLLVVASRRQALDFTSHLTEGHIRDLTSYELKPFSPSGVYAFLLRWPYAPGLDPPTEAARLFTQLRVNRTLLDTCSNPLALALYVVRDLRLREGGSVGGLAFTDTRGGFLADLVDYLLTRRRTDRLKVQGPNLPFRQSRRDYLVAAVKAHVDEGQPFNRINEETLVELAPRLTREDQTPDQALRELAKDSGILEQNDDGTWSFIHRTFLDYFLACDLATISNSRKLESLFKRMARDGNRYTEGFYISCGLMADRSHPYLTTVLERLGRNKFVGTNFPRACLESQAYFFDGFVEGIRSWCHVWRKTNAETLLGDSALLHDLVAVLVDYESACVQLGRPPKLTLKGQLWSQLQDAGIPVLEAAQLDVDLALRIADLEDVHQLFSESRVEDAVVALYEPSVAEQLARRDADSDPRMSALLVEAALRSSLIAQRLAPRRTAVFKGSRRLSRHVPRWAEVWPVRGANYGQVLAAALPYVDSLDLHEKADFPHLAVLSRCTPVRRLRYELIIGTSRLRTLWSLGVLAFVALAYLAGAGALGAIGVAVLGVGLTSSLLAIPAARGRFQLPSRSALNLQLSGGRFSSAPRRRTKLVAGTSHSLHRWSVGTPRSADGSVLALYDHLLPLIWRRFSPALGDRRLSRDACSEVHHYWTEDIRPLFQELA